MQYNLPPIFCKLIVCFVPSSFGVWRPSMDNMELEMVPQESVYLYLDSYFWDRYKFNNP